MKVQIDTTQNVVIEYEVAGYMERIGATIIDLIMLTIYSYIVILIDIGIFASGNFKFQWVVVVLTFVPVLFYNLLCELLMHGQSIGKRIMKIKVVKLDGTQPELGAYLLRWLLWWVEVPATSGSVALLTVMANGRGQRLGDIAAGTTTVKVGKGVRLHDTILTRLAPDYQPVFPQVTLLNDRDVALIKEVVNSRERSNNLTIVDALVKKLEQTLDIRNSTAPLTFLRTIVKDYNYYTGGMVG